MPKVGWRNYMKWPDCLYSPAIFCVYSAGDSKSPAEYYSPEYFFDPLYNSYFLKLHSSEPFRMDILREGRKPMDFKH